MEGKIMHPKSRPAAPARSQSMLARPSRPAGLKSMGPAMYEEIRRAVREMEQQARASRL